MPPIDENEFVIQDDPPAPIEDEGGEAGGEEDAEGDQGAGSEEGAPPEAAKTEEAARKPRRERKAERGREHQELTRIRQELEDQRRANADLQQQMARGLGDATRQLGDVAKSMAPTPKPLRETLKEDLRKRAQSIREGDEESLDRFLDANIDIAQKLGAEEARRVVREEMAARDRNAPAQLSPAEQRLSMRFPWIFEENGRGQPVHWPVVAAYATAIAQKERRNMNDPAIKERTVAEAAARFAREFDKPVYDPTGGDSGARAAAKERASGTGGRNGAAGGGGGEISGAAYVLRSKIAKDAADRFYPNLKGQARYDKYYKEVVEPELRRSASRGG